MCQLVHCGTEVLVRKSDPASLLPIAFKVRQRRAGSAVRGGGDSPAHAKMRLIAQQFAPSLFVPIKAAPFDRNIDPENPALPQPWP
jgi:hypothetical protein